MSVCDVTLAAALRITAKPLLGDVDREICSVLTLLALTNWKLSRMEVSDKPVAVRSMRGGAGAASNCRNNDGALNATNNAKHSVSTLTLTDWRRREIARQKLGLELGVCFGDCSKELCINGTA